MGRCLAVGVLTVATFVVVAILSQAWLVALGVAIAFLVWFWQMSRGTDN